MRAVGAPKRFIVYLLPRTQNRIWLTRGMRPLRILHIAPYSARAWAYGGIPRVVASLTRTAADAGHRVTLCTTDARDAAGRLDRPDGRRGAHAAWPALVEPSGVEVRVFPNLSNAAAYHWQAFAPLGLDAYLAAHARDFDVAHLHACRNLPGVLAARHLRRAGVPYVLQPNGTAPRLERRLAAKAVFDRVAGQRVLDGATALIAVTETERRQLLALGVDDARIHIVGNPIDPAEFEETRPRGAFRARFGLGSDPIVLFLGKQTPRKRLDVLVRAFERLGNPRAQLVIAGNDMGAGRDTRRLVATLGLAARVTFTGLLRGPERLDALADADVVVYPSEDEIFGLVPLESVLAGTPVVVADDSGCGEVVRGTGGGLVTPIGDAGALASAIAGVLDAPEVWRARVRDAAGVVRARYGGDVVGHAVEQVYGRMLAAARPHPAQAPAPPADADGGVSVVVPIRNGAASVRQALESVFADAEATGRPFEVIAIDDGSTDGSERLLAAMADTQPLRVLAGYGRGAAAALNLGLAAARYPFIAQVDQDVVLHRGWLSRLLAELRDPRVAAAQGQYIPVRGARLASRVMALDLAWRYAGITGCDIDHVCTGNSLYRRSALAGIGGFDESLGYGYDNDASYRLRAAGHRLVFCREATSEHRWRDGLAGYCAQQYGLGYGRLDVVARHPRRVTGDDVSPAAMMAHPALMAAAVGLATIAGLATVAGGSGTPLAVVAAAIVAALAIERLVAGVRAALRFSDPAALLFPVFHLIRDVVWVQAAGVWALRHQRGRPTQPGHSMQPRPGTGGAPGRAPLGEPARVLAVIPAHNEAPTLAGVIAGLRASWPDLDLLVVDDGSTDGTEDVLTRLGVRWLRFPERLGIGNAMRAGLRYARRLSYDAVVRLDGDGQHAAGDIAWLLAPVRAGTFDAAFGSRYPHGPAGPRSRIKRALAACLSAVTGTRITDPTSGFCAFGPRAIRVLADHHPTGYPEPELRLFLARNGLIATEVGVSSRQRQGGRSSLTTRRLATAAARVLLAMLIVPLRPVIRGVDGE